MTRTLPSLRLRDGKSSDGVVLALYAPFGGDALLSSYGGATALSNHPMTQHLLEVAVHGTHVCALIDLKDDETWLIQIPAHGNLTVVSRWKQDLTSPRTLAGFIEHVLLQFPSAAVMLALEGHGAGYIPDLDLSQLTTDKLSRKGDVMWEIRADGGRPVHSGKNPTLPMGSPMLPMGSPMLPMGSPMLPVQGYPMSTWELGWALAEGLRRVPKRKFERLAALHFNNCFNMAVEVMHTVAPFAEWAVGYPNYNFFTAGQAYPALFAKLALAQTMPASVLAYDMAAQNRLSLVTSESDHPTVAGVVDLQRMPALAKAIHDLGAALTKALTDSRAPHRAGVIEKIRDALIRAQQYDSWPDHDLDVPDELTDIASFAFELRTFDTNAAEVHAATKAVLSATSGMRAYGDVGHPWVAPNKVWDFSRKELAMSILCMDPMRKGLWDWRSPFYLQTNPGQCPAQLNIIDFLRGGAGWVDFIVEYHRDAPFASLRPAPLNQYPDRIDAKHPRRQAKDA